MKLFLCLLVVAGLIACTDSTLPTAPTPISKTDTLTIVRKDTVFVTVTVHDTVTVTVRDTVFVTQTVVVHDTIRVPVVVSTLGEVDTLYATRMGLSPIRESLPGGWISQRWEDDWAVSVSWWYNPAWVNRRLVVHTQDGGVQYIGSGRDLHVFAGEKSRIDGWWDTGFTTRGDK